MPPILHATECNTLKGIILARLLAGVRSIDFKIATTREQLANIEQISKDHVLFVTV